MSRAIGLVELGALVLAFLLVTGGLIAWRAPNKAQHCSQWIAGCEASQLFTRRECAQQAFLRFECGARP